MLTSTVLSRRIRNRRLCFNTFLLLFCWIPEEFIIVLDIHHSKSKILELINIAKNNMDWIILSMHGKDLSHSCDVVCDQHHILDIIIARQNLIIT